MPFFVGLYTQRKYNFRRLARLHLLNGTGAKTRPSAGGASPDFQTWETTNPNQRFSVH